MVTRDIPHFKLGKMFDKTMTKVEVGCPRLPNIEVSAINLKNPEQLSPAVVLKTVIIPALENQPGFYLLPGIAAAGELERKMQAALESFND